jgi:prolipoprotein diacylglyceryl transferase
MLTHIVSELSPEIFSIGAITIRWYGLLFGLTFIAGYIIIAYTFMRENKKLDDVYMLIVYVLIGTVIGARLGHCLFYEPDYYLLYPAEILKIWKGGLASHGGAIGILTALYLFSQKSRGYSFLWTADRIVIAVALGGFFIRLGNFINSEIYGIPTDVPWAVVFAVRDNIPRHPTQIYEALTYFSIFILLFTYYKRKIKLNSLPKEGFLFGLFLVLVFASRFMWEFLKEVQSDFEHNLLLDMGQILSIPFIILGIAMLIRSQRNKPNN